MIRVENLSKKIGETQILNSINFQINDGEILGFLGPNGAGKTTTMKIITGFWTPTSGNVFVNDKNVIENSLEIRGKLGYLPETVPLYDEMKVYEYLKFIAEIRGIAPEKIKDSIKSVVNSCGLEKVIKKPIEELSKGYRQRVGLAQAIIHEPDIIVLDEPTTGLDPNQIIEIRNLIKEIGKNKTVIFSTHILSEVQATCDRIIIIKDGIIVGQGTPSELAQSAGGQEKIYVKIKGPQETVKRLLEEIKEIKEIIEKDREAEDILGYELLPQDGMDIREILSVAVMQNNWSILEFSKKSASMEDVFRELTK
ncbi:MAG: ATP-binding cassette domain-containing protein [Patescibacteria group bacterium]|jgi:ABC-2 type transport system ATP-binding protein